MFGTPCPVWIRVVHKLPPPIPTLNPSAPQSDKSFADCSVETLPAITSTFFGNTSLSFLIIFFTFLWCPCATSINIIFAPQLTNRSALSISLLLTPIATIMGMSLASACQSSYITPHFSYI